MSETLTEPTAAPESPAEFLEGVADTPAAEVIETPAEPDPEPAQKPDKIERRVGNLTRKLADEGRARAAAEARAEAAEALLRSRDPDAPEPGPRHAAGSADRAQIIAEHEFNRRMSEIDETGKKNLGVEQWDQSKATMISFGATANTAFLQALAETENPDKIFADLADDTDALMELLSKPPAAMAARLGKMDAKLSAPPPARALSSAPPPAPKLKLAGVAPEPTPYDYPAGMSMKEYNRMMDNWLPPSLGGKKTRS